MQTDQVCFCCCCFLLCWPKTENGKPKANASPIRKRCQWLRQTLERPCQLLMAVVRPLSPVLFSSLGFLFARSLLVPHFSFALFANTEWAVAGWIVFPPSSCERLSAYLKFNQLAFISLAGSVFNWLSLCPQVRESYFDVFSAAWCEKKLANN